MLGSYISGSWGTMSEKRETVPAGSAAATVAPADVARIWAVMSHEIRTPLMGVVGMLEVLNRTSLTDEQRRIIATAEESSVTLMGIIDDVLDFAKLESTEVKLEEGLADPVAIVESTAELLANIAGSKRLGLACEAVGDLPLVMCDALRLRQVLLNIGTNAVKYTDSGSVTLTVAQVGAAADAVTLRFSVADTGQGIPAELQGYLFEPFWQLAGRESSFGGGMGGVGLGLAICRTLVDAMDGEIAIDSQAGKGTRFDVDITFKKAAKAAPGVPRLEDAEIVTVDTGEASLAIALRYLEHAGASIVRVDNHGAIARYTPAAQRRTTILFGADTEAEDVEATAAALQRMGSEHMSSIVWLHRGAAGSLPVRSGVWPVRANPMRRAELFAAVMRLGGAREGDGFAVVARHQQRLVDPTDAVQAARADGLVILVAEDNKVNQEVLRQQLAILGYDCDIAPTGHAALKALSERRYPLLLCDCHMPGMDGFELTRMIRTGEGSGARMPIVAVTANAVPGEAARCRAAGMDDYLAKPIEIGSLQAKLNHWIGPTQARAVWAGGAPPAVKEAPDRVLDLRGLSVIYGNDPIRLSPVLEQWAVSMTEVLKDLDDSIAAKKWDLALAATHRLKGTAGVAGAPRLSAAAAALEVALHGGDATTIARDSARVRSLTLAGLNEAADWRRAANDYAALSEKAASGARI
jgi:two-component system sensor histidine kinase/response regulator